MIKSYLITGNDNDAESLKAFIKIIQESIDVFSFERLVELYEFVVSPADKIVNGAVYTPKHIRDFITTQTLSRVINEYDRLRIADISCGCGGFLLTAAQKLKDLTHLSYAEIFKNNLFGIDIQEYAITRTKILLSLLAINENEDIEVFDFNLFIDNTLTFNFNEHINNFTGFDIILGNPPYVCSRHLNAETKAALMRWSVCNSGHPDLYIPFFQIGMEALSTNGILGYITMNSFFKSLNGRSLRLFFQNAKFDFNIIDFGSEQVFKSKNTYTCICLIKKRFCEYISFCRIKTDNVTEAASTMEKIDYKELDFFKGWNLQNNKLISKIENTGTPLGTLYKTRHGIATLKNDIYIFSPSFEDELYYYLSANNTKYPIEKTICREIVNSNKIKDNTILQDITEKVIFPYNNDHIPKPISEKQFMDDFPMAYNYLCAMKEILQKRDKGNGKYETWFCFGRTQSLEKMRHKLFFPKIANKTPSCIINSEETMLFYNGQAILGNSEEELYFVKKIMESRLFWYYIKTTSKPYSSDYFSLNGNYIKNFGIYKFTDEEKQFLLQENDKCKIDQFIESKYNIYLD